MCLLRGKGVVVTSAVSRQECTPQDCQEGSTTTQHIELCRQCSCAWHKVHIQGLVTHVRRRWAGGPQGSEGLTPGRPARRCC